ncbi:MAG: SufD family Fe-S cluster assembly protein [Chloroflexota bacterium]|nr:SufD family Fe-S cluster assembly protein [Chloroflexota bacterium]
MKQLDFNDNQPEDSLNIDLGKYRAVPDTPSPALIAPGQVPPADARVMTRVGVSAAELERSATYIQEDFFPVCVAAHSEYLELLPIADALAKYDWLREKYYWQAVPANQDKYTAQASTVSEPQGYFIRVKAGAKIPYPVQACLYMTRGDIVQTVHNIVILEEGAELKLITGCTMRDGVRAGVHIGITESYVGINAKLTSTMVHSWSQETQVRPHSGTIVEAGGAYVENYCSLQPAKSVKTNPKTWLDGKGASAKYLTIILGSEGAAIDTGGEVYLNGKNTSAELAHRAVCTGGRINQTGLLVGSNVCRAHVDCAGMVVDARNDGFILSIPGLRSSHPEARMSHEASIGKIAPEQVEYLQSRGMDEREAISLIIRGFLGADVFGLGAELDARIEEIAELAGHGEA